MLTEDQNRNLDVKVVKGAGGITNEVSFDVGDVSARDLDLQRFNKAFEMTDYEFDAYATFGDEELNRQGVQTLHDLFGKEWADAFYKRKNGLITSEKLVALYAEREVLNQTIAGYEAQL